jgi:hypothetical protein
MSKTSLTDEQLFPQYQRKPLKFPLFQVSVFLRNSFQARKKADFFSKLKEEKNKKREEEENQQVAIFETGECWFATGSIEQLYHLQKWNFHSPITRMLKTNPAFVALLTNWTGRLSNPTF